MTALRIRRRTQDRRYLGPTCLAGSGPANIAMIDRAMRKGRRQLARAERRTPRPLSAYLRGNPRTAAAWERRLADPRSWPRAMRPTDAEEAEFRLFIDGMYAGMVSAFAIPSHMLSAGPRLRDPIDLELERMAARDLLGATPAARGVLPIRGTPRS